MKEPQFPSGGYRETIDETPESIRVLVLGQHALVRSGIRALLERIAEVEVSEAENEQLVAAVDEFNPQVLLLDVVTPGLSGLELLNQVARKFPSTPMIVLVGPKDQEQAAQALRLGAAGLVAKTAASNELESAIHAVANGERHLSEILREAAVNYSEVQPTSLSELTPRQYEVLKLIAEGNTTKEIARRLKISTKTVETHRARIMERLNIYDVAGLVHYALRTGLIQLHE